MWISACPGDQYRHWFSHVLEDRRALVRDDDGAIFQLDEFVDAAGNEGRANGIGDQLRRKDAGNAEVVWVILPVECRRIRTSKSAEAGTLTLVEPQESVDDRQEGKGGKEDLVLDVISPAH
jgi:hypothetical protein